MTDIPSSPEEERDLIPSMDEVDNFNEDLDDLNKEEQQGLEIDQEDQEAQESLEKSRRIASTEAPDMLSSLEFRPTTLLNREYDADKILEKRDVHSFLAKYRAVLSDEAYEELEDQVKNQIERNVKPRWEIEQKLANERYRNEAKTKITDAMKFDKDDLKNSELQKGGYQAFEELMKNRGLEAIDPDSPVKGELEFHLDEQMKSLYAEWKGKCEKNISEADMKAMNILNMVKGKLERSVFSRSELIDNAHFWKDTGAFESFIKNGKFFGLEKAMKEIEGLNPKKHDELQEMVSGLINGKGYENWKQSYIDVQEGRLESMKKEVDTQMTMTPDDITNESYAKNPKAFQDAMFRKMGSIDPTALENEQEADLKQYITELSDKKYVEWQKLHSGEMTTEQTTGSKKLRNALSLSKKEMMDEKYDDPKEFEKLMRKKGSLSIKELPDGVRADMEKGMGAQIKKLHQKHIKERKKILEKQAMKKKTDIFKKSGLNVSFSKLDQGILERGTPRMNVLRKMPELRPFLGGTNTLFEPLIHIWTVMLDEGGGESGFQAMKQRLQGVKDKNDPQAVLNAMLGASSAREALKRVRATSEQAWMQFEMGMAGLGVGWESQDTEETQDSEDLDDVHELEGLEELELEESEEIEEIEEEEEEVGEEEHSLNPELMLREVIRMEDTKKLEDLQEEKEENEKVEEDVEELEEPEEAVEDTEDIEEKEMMENDEFGNGLTLKEPVVLSEDDNEEIDKEEEHIEELVNELNITSDEELIETDEPYEEAVEEQEVEFGEERLAMTEMIEQDEEEQGILDTGDELENLEQNEESQEEQEDETEKQEMLKLVLEALEREQAEEDELEEEQDVIPLNEVALHQDMGMLEKMMKEQIKIHTLYLRMLEDEENIEGLEQLISELQQMLMLESLNATLDHNRLFDALQKKLALEKWWEEHGFIITAKSDFDTFLSQYTGDVTVSRALQIFCYYVNMVTGKSVARKIIADRSLLKVLVKNPRELMRDLMAQFREFSRHQKDPFELAFQVSERGNQAQLKVSIIGEDALLRKTYTVELGS
ncbi:MAG: hypothetical protein P1V18_00210 [Candidatus Gracilibacteria bacterium]|nr:hypothetical protein [Candidatus Gracilibacteria bacterium]